MIQSWLFLAIAIVNEVIATSALKLSDGFTRPVPTIIVVVGYILAFYFLSLTLRCIPVGVAYAVWSGLGMVLVSVISLVLYGQKLDFAAILGMEFIIAGVIIMNLSSKSLSH